MASAQGATFYNLSPQDFIFYLGARGFDPEYTPEPGFEPVVYATRDGVNFAILFYQCDEATLEYCERFQFRARFTLDGKDDENTLEVMNQFNLEWVFGKAYINDDNEAVIEYPLTVENGLSKRNLLAQFDLWEYVLDDFLAHIEW